MEEKTTHIKAKKSLGQHFLNNSRIPKRMADAAAVTAEDIVVEIGPGTGVLTRELLSRGATVIAIEADARAIEVLQATFIDEIMLKKLIIIAEDIRTYPPTALTSLIGKQPYKVVANIPYYLSGLLFRTFLETTFQPVTLVFLVQKEVAERIARDPKESLLSLSVKVYGMPTYVTTVKRGNFTPPPKVDSAVVLIQDISKKNLENIDERSFFELIHAGFGAKRKQLLGNLSAFADREALIHIFKTVGMSKTVRAEDLPLQKWLELAHSFPIHTFSTKK